MDEEISNAGQRGGLTSATLSATDSPSMMAARPFLGLCVPDIGAPAARGGSAVTPARRLIAERRDCRGFALLGGVYNRRMQTSRSRDA